MKRKLGVTQKAVLGALVRHGSWSTDGCGWLWDSASNTLRIMESLVRAGVATVKVTKRHWYEVRTYKPVKGESS